MNNSGPTRWPCVGCGTNLGNVAFGELAVDLTACATVNTDNVNVILICKKCGRQKAWFAKPASVEGAFVDTLTDRIAEKVKKKLEKSERKDG